MTPKEIKIDFEAYKRRVKEQQQLAWLQGAYFKQALQSSILICGLADRQVANKMPKYPEMPYKEEVEQQKAQDEKWLQAQRQRAFAYFSTLLSRNKK